MSTLYRNVLSGVVDNNPLSNSGTSLSSTGLANMPEVAGGDVMWLVLDPEGVDGQPEIVQVTSHSTSATTATIVRGQQTGLGGGAARSHDQGTPWVHALTVEDIDDIISRVSVTEGDILSLQGDVSSLGDDISALDGRVLATEGDISDLQALLVAGRGGSSNTVSAGTSYTSSGATVTMTTNTLVKITLTGRRTSGSDSGRISYAISGSTTVAADDSRSVVVQGVPEPAVSGLYSAVLLANTTPGSNTFTAYVKSSANSNTFYVGIIVERLN